LPTPLGHAEKDNTGNERELDESRRGTKKHNHREQRQRRLRSKNVED